MKIALTLAVVLMLVDGICGKRTTVLTNPTGDIAPRRGTEALTYKIRVNKGYKIVLAITSLDMDSRSRLTVQDGLRGVAYVFKNVGGSVLNYQEHRRDQGVLAELPARFQTETRKLIIKYEPNGGAGRFTARYASFNEVGLCNKENLANIHKSIKGKSCDSDSLAPVASECNVTLSCTDNYVQYNKRMECKNGDWDGLIDCRPRQDLMDLCKYDFDDFTVSNCPYEPMEIVQHMVQVENVDVHDGSSVSGRSSGVSINCNAVCGFDSYGRRPKCNRRIRREFIKCFICRIAHRCQAMTIAF